MTMRSSPTRNDEKQDPAVITTDKLYQAIATGNMHAFNVALDAAVVFQSPMGMYVGRPTVRSWVEFEVKMLRPFEHLIRRHGTFSEDGLRVGRLEWSIGGLHITDVVTQTQLLTIRSIKRTIRRQCHTMQDHEVAEALLLAWTGPHFSKFLAPPGKGLIDSKAVILPVLDYGFKGLTNVRSLLVEEPNDGTSAIDNNIVFHFEAASQQEDNASLRPGTAPGGNDDAASKQGDSGDASPRSNFGSPNRRGTTITIQAKNRLGEVNAIVIDRTALDGKNGGENTKLDALEEAEVNGPKRDRRRYVASGLRVSNNELVRVHELEQVARVFLVNAFYFLTMVDLSSNALVEIPELSQLLSLQALYLHDNQIERWGELDKLQGLMQLNALTLFGNPLQQKSESSKMYKYTALHFFYSAEGFKCFPTRQQTLMQQAQTGQDKGRPLSRLQRALVAGGRGSPSPAAMAAPSSSQGGRNSPSPFMTTTAAQLPIRESTASLAARRLNDISSSASLLLIKAEQQQQNPRSRQASAGSPVLATASIRLRQFDHVTLSPLEVEALERFLPVIKRQLRRAASPVAKKSPAVSMGAKANRDDRSNSVKLS